MVITLDHLNKLKDNSFEKLIKTLLLSVIGNGVTPFSQGKDGAREAVFKGKANYPSKIDNWDGSWIFQVKFSDITLGIEKARDKIKYSINTELRKLEDYGYFTTNECDNYIYITNVPFSGEAGKGMHDYIGSKKKIFKVKNFDYWDGEKIISLLNSNNNVRETFFPIKGINIIDNILIEGVSKLFVKPNHYEEIKKIILVKRFVNVTGQPHVGKTYLATNLAGELLNELKLNNILIIPLIDSLESIPKIENCVIIFDDLYGDVNYESIGRKTKIINSLKKSNYVIVTSREYIFKEANKKGETIDYEKSDLIINQEGAYSDEQLSQILTNHLNVNFPSGLENIKAYSYIINNNKLIVQQLRFPHNIQLFTTLVDKYTDTKVLLDSKISQAKEIEEVVLSWIGTQSETNKNILLALAIGKIQDVEILYSICSIQWNYSKEIINDCLLENSKILTFNNPLIRFIHPSFKSAIIKYFINSKKKEIVDLVINLIGHPEYIAKRAINRALAYSLFTELNNLQLKDLILNPNLKKNYTEVAWFNLIKLNIDYALSTLVEISNIDYKLASRHFACFVSTKDFMKDGEIIKVIDLLFTKRASKLKLIDNLIIHFSFRIRSKIRQVIEKLDIENTPRDYKLKIKLLGVIGSKYPEKVFDELISAADSKYPSTRGITYTALNMLDNSYKNNVKEAFERFNLVEFNKSQKLKIQKTLRNIQSHMK